MISPTTVQPAARPPLPIPFSMIRLDEGVPSLDVQSIATVRPNAGGAGVASGLDISVIEGPGLTTSGTVDARTAAQIIDTTRAMLQRVPAREELTGSAASIPGQYRTLTIESANGTRSYDLMSTATDRSTAELAAAVGHAALQLPRPAG